MRYESTISRVCRVMKSAIAQGLRQPEVSQPANQNGALTTLGQAHLSG
jgi:hypothetical protein